MYSAPHHQSVVQVSHAQTFDKVLISSEMRSATPKISNIRQLFTWNGDRPVDDLMVVAQPAEELLGVVQAHAGFVDEHGVLHEL